MSVRVVFCLHRLRGLTREEFSAYWRDVHGPLVRERAGVLRIAGYEQAHSMPGSPAAPVAALRGAPEEFDGIATLEFASIEDFYAAGSTPEGRRAARELLEDERRFIDLARSPIWMVDEVRIV
jgi:uncharacterized protein (TIGR02118 family)